jgi:hypothetical protein
VRIAEQEQMLRLEAANPDFDPMVVSEDQIEALYRVVASMRMY